MSARNEALPKVDRAALRDKAEAFGRLHRGPETLVLPNAWDAGSAALLAQAGFAAIATTSAGIAHAQGFADREYIGRTRMLEVVARIVRRVNVPVTADLEAGYGAQPQHVAQTIREAIAVGVVGVNIEDTTASSGPALLEEALSVARIRAAREAAAAEDIPFVINARTDAYLLPGEKGPGTFDLAVRRLNAYLAAGATCAFVPGVTDPELIGRLVRAIEGPLNVLSNPGMAVAEMQTLGVARISIGSALSRVTLGLVQRAAREILEQGTFTFAADGLPLSEANALLEQ